MTLIAEQAVVKEKAFPRAQAPEASPETENLVVLEGVSWDTYETLVAETGDERKAHFAYSNEVLEITVESSTLEKLVTLEGVSWNTYKTLVAETGDERKARFAYSSGVLEIVMPSGSHESIKHILERIITTLTEELDLPVKGYASTTFNQKGLKKGAELDACFYIKNCEQIINKETRNIDLSQDPAPDLVIEIDISHPSILKREVYAAMGVVELWRFYKGKVEIYHLRQDHYQLVNKSLAFPMLISDDLNNWLELHNNIDDNTLIRIVRKWLREQLKENL